MGTRECMHSERSHVTIPLFAPNLREVGSRHHLLKLLNKLERDCEHLVISFLASRANQLMDLAHQKTIFLDSTYNSTIAATKIFASHLHRARFHHPRHRQIVDHHHPSSCENHWCAVERFDPLLIAHWHVETLMAD